MRTYCCGFTREEQSLLYSSRRLRRFCIVTNVDKVLFSGNKLEDKIYINFSGYPGGKKEETAKSLLKRRPEAVIERAVKGMLPKNRLGRKMYKKLFVYAGAEHPHGAQQPKTLKF